LTRIFTNPAGKKLCAKSRQEAKSAKKKNLISFLALLASWRLLARIPGS